VATRRQTQNSKPDIPRPFRSPDPNQPTRAEKIAAIRKSFFADVDAMDSDVLNLPPRTGDPYYQPGVVCAGGVWRVRGKAIPSPNDEKVRLSKIQEVKDWQREIERLKSNVASNQQDIEDLAQLARGSSLER
jgi:hypothetical protein